MKKQLLILSVLALSFTSRTGQAQLVNVGFETWTANALNSAAMDPNGGNGTSGWWDFNGLSSSFAGASPITVLRSDTAHSGTYSARIQTVVYTPTSYAYISSTLKDTNGVIVTGKLTAGLSGSKFVSGIPFTQKITQFSFYYQYKPNGVDTAEAEVALYKFVSGARVQTGGGIFKSAVATGSTWQQANVTITALDTLTPDTIVIVLSSSSLFSKPKPGSVMWVDDASVVSPAGVVSVFGNETGVEVYPNPASTSINFRINGMNTAATVTIFDITGQKVGNTLVHNGLTSINTQAYSNGLYFYQLYDNAGSLLKSGKFSVVK